MATKGIDVSAWQRTINWDSVKASGIKFAILKAGGSDDGIYTDGYFERNYAECKRVGIPVGAYWFVGKGCVSADDGEADAKQFVKRLEGKQFELPVYMDVEVTPLSKRTGATNAAIAFCNYLENQGYYAGIYGSTYSTFESRLDDSRLTRYAHWVAQYANSCSYWGTVGIWQYTSSAYVAGITTGTVDMNYLYIDYETVIKKMGRNGYKAADKKPAASKTADSSKLEINGKWDAATTKRLQKKLGVKKVDGEIWHQVEKWKRFLPNCEADSWRFEKDPKECSPTILALQKKIKAVQDGWAGENTIRCLQVFLNSYRGIDLVVDGKCGEKTVKALQKWLNM